MAAPQIDSWFGSTYSFLSVMRLPEVERSTAPSVANCFGCRSEKFSGTWPLYVVRLF